MPKARLTHIRRAIERKRKEMHTLSDRFGIQSEIVIRKSQELDGLLNRYDQLGIPVKK
ncbi:aspartyl-phosphate phosphatase Spo0E family protein (plasmid) [Paenibacillus rhizovicinus]|uniref:Aspartyl-phosphate phosphatase Spo0E family protein n=1 Tax=Paenibacillus rhizovicinus TaxID=2704463 RepID=A0A6C0PA89_9BACL|nr:aspartyl-phosphate phosphatase Spo0E family protein [Paenibacillus rhizovicinus]QHW35494.1 aspartyl-phosphate phosphatase Spo0E family protein [Paenibacillus rhizovicinus]